MWWSVSLLRPDGRQGRGRGWAAGSRLVMHAGRSEALTEIAFGRCAMQGGCGKSRRAIARSSNAAGGPPSRSSSYGKSRVTPSARLFSRLQYVSSALRSASRQTKRPVAGVAARIGMRRSASVWFSAVLPSQTLVSGVEQQLGELGETVATLGPRQPTRRRSERAQEPAEVGDADLIGKIREHRRVVGRIADEDEARRARRRASMPKHSAHQQARVMVSLS